MPPKSRAEILNQRNRLAQSYQELLDQFSSKDLATVGNYALGRLIGKGSFGKVYLASHKLIRNSKVVLKSANKTDSNLAREIHHHRQFLHSHIARLYEVIVTESLVWLVLEYCPGDELYHHLTENGRLPPDQVQKIFTQLVGAVAYVHNMSCVHRDLKLENILLDKNGNVKLCDFGFTREYEGKASYLQTFCGTVCYSAPEMLRGEKYAGEKVDVWSLGVILYALLVGELPFDEDDENATKIKILTTEPNYPDYVPEEAKALIMMLLSKRPLLRPSLSDILAHPFLSEYAPQQQAILKVQQPAPFTTQLEKDTLERMRGAGVDIDQVIENVLARRCDSLAGWWGLLIEKEERKEKRRERKRAEKERETKTLRRLSAASSRLDRMTPTLKDVAEEAEHTEYLTVEGTSARGRQQRRSSSNPQKPSLEMPSLSEAPAESPPASIPPPPIEKDSVVPSRNSSRQRPNLPQRELRRSRASTLQLVQANPDLLSPTGIRGRKRGRHQHAFLNQLASLKHWFKSSTKRTKPHQSNSQQRQQEKLPATSSSEQRRPSMPSAGKGSLDIAQRPGMRNSATYPQRTTSLNTTPRKTISQSPGPLTPRSSLRRPSAGLRGRKSTSSSVSSIRSIHHHHTHSKASSTSSTSITSSNIAVKAARSPHDSVKVLPATPTTSTFPSGVRLVRGPPPTDGYNENALFGPSSPGLVFAKRKKSPFKGPMLGVNTGGGLSPGGISARMPRESSLTRAGAGGGGRTSLEAIAQEEEDEDEEVEEVEAFSPILEPGIVEETIIEADHGIRDD